MNLNINNSEIEPIKLNLITYRFNWAHHKIGIESQEEKCFHNALDLQNFVSTIAVDNDKFKRDAKKSKDSYYLSKFLESI